MAPVGLNLNEFRFGYLNPVCRERERESGRGFQVPVGRTEFVSGPPTVNFLLSIEICQPLLWKFCNLLYVLGNGAKQVQARLLPTCHN